MWCRTSARRCGSGIRDSAATSATDASEGGGTSGGGPCPRSTVSDRRARRQRLTASRYPTRATHARGWSYERSRPHRDQARVNASCATSWASARLPV